MRFLWYYYDNAYTKDECSALLDLALSKKSDYVFDKPSDGKNLSVNVANSDSMSPSLDKFFDMVTMANEEVFGFSLYGKPRSININTYTVGNEYNFHYDGTIHGSPSDVKLTAVLNVSQENYIGGEFEFFNQQPQEVPQINKVGSLLVFPSFLYHRVKPVISGKRTTISAWFSGPNWK